MQPRGAVAIFMGIVYTASAVTTTPPTLSTTPIFGQQLLSSTQQTLDLKSIANPTTTTTFTAWDSAVSLSLSSGTWKSSGSIGSSLLSSSGGSSGTASQSLNSDMSNSGARNSLGSQASGSSGLFLRIWSWVLITLLGGCCCLIIGGAFLAFLMKKQSKPASRRQRQAPRDRDLEVAPMLEEGGGGYEEPSYEQPPPAPIVEAAPPTVQQAIAPAPIMEAEPLANSYYTQYPGGSQYMQYTQPPMGGMQTYQPSVQGSIMQPMTQFQPGAPGYVV